MIEEFPGLQSKMFTSIGKYGIGFFSVFMWGDKVSVTSRKYNQSINDTWCLEFRSLNSKPLIRKANENELVNQGGTTIKVWVREKKTIAELFDVEIVDLNELSLDIAPALSVDLFIRKGNKKIKVSKASDWLELPVDEFIYRINRDEYGYQQRYSNEKNLGVSVDMIYDNEGNIIGRGFISMMFNYPGYIITNKGLKTGGVYSEIERGNTTFHGIIEGESINASRNLNKIKLGQAEFNTWVTKQVEKLSSLKMITMDKVWYALSAISLGGNPLNLPFAAQQINGRIKWLGYSDIVKKIRNEKFCLIVHGDFIGDSIETRTNLSSEIIIDTYSYQQQTILDEIEGYDYGRNYSRNTGLHWVEAALKEAWSVDTLNVEYFDGDDDDSKEGDIRLEKTLKLLGLNSIAASITARERYFEAIAIRSKSS